MLRWFKRKSKLKSYLLENKYRIVEAFVVNGKKYYMFDDAFQTPTGRAMCSLTIYEEFRQRCTREYLEKHVRAMEIILSDPKKIDVQNIAILNKNLKERLALVPFPDHIYRLASIEYFDDSESPYSYNFEYNNKKIEEWKAAGGMLDFFSKRLMTDLMPSLNLPLKNVDIYFQVSEAVDQMHRSDLRDISSRQQ